MKFAAVLLTAAACAAAAPALPIDSLVDMARAVPGEFAADAMIRIAALESVDKPRKIALLEEAFRRASEAQQPYRRRAAITRGAPAAAFYNRVYEQELDGLSLQLRAIEALLPLDGRKARGLFTQIPRLNIPKVPCEEFLVYDVSRYYPLLARVAAETFSKQEIEKREPFHLLLQNVSVISAPAQVGPAARAVLAAGGKDADFQALVSAYAGALSRIAGDDRSVTFTRGAGGDIAALVEELKRRKLSPLPLLESYRYYLVNNLSGPHCEDDDLMRDGGQGFGLNTAAAADAGDAVAYFNQALRQPPLATIGADEVAPQKVEGKAVGLQACDDADCKAIATRIRGLAISPQGRGYSQADRQTLDWQSRLGEVLDAIEAWKPDPANKAAYFRNRSALYADLLNLAPTPETQQTVVDAMLAFAQREKYAVPNRIEWFLPLNALVGRVSLDRVGLGRMLDEFRRSSDPVVALYAEMEIIAPRGPQRVMPLL